MPLLPADFIQPSLQINLRIILDGTNKKKKVKAVAAGLLRICCTIHRERNQVEISPGKTSCLLTCVLSCVSGSKG